MGYWQDDYIQYFVTNYERKTPEINRGYYARTKGVALFLDKFLKVRLDGFDWLRLVIRCPSAGFIFLFLFFIENRIKLSNHKSGRRIRHAILATERERNKDQ